MEVFRHPIKNALFNKINYTHLTTLINLAGLLNFIPKVSEQQSTNRHNGRWCEVEKEPEQASAQVIHNYLTGQQKNQSSNPKEKTQTRKPVRPPRVEPSKTPMETP